MVPNRSYFKSLDEKLCNFNKGNLDLTFFKICLSIFEYLFIYRIVNPIQPLFAYKTVLVTANMLLKWKDGPLCQI